MATMPHTEMFVTVGVDTHKDIHVAVALDQLGRKLDAIEIPTTSAGYAELLIWATGLGTVDRFGIEGTGSHGAGLCRWLTARGLIVIEVDRPDRRLRRNKGKSDTIDAESAARKVLSGESTATPKAQNGTVEQIRILRLTRRSAVVAQGQASNQIHALIATAPDELRDQLRDLTTRKRVAAAARFRPDRQADPILATTKLALKKLARRFLDLDAEIKDLNRRLDELVAATAPAMVARRGIGTHTAATLLVTAGDNPDRLRSEASFAALAGTSPLEASSGPRIRHRLNRGGDRDANAALHMIAVNRLANGHEPTRAYIRKRTGGDKADLDTLRRLKRYIAREVYPLLREAITHQPERGPRAA
jgi:transposase